MRILFHFGIWIKDLLNVIQFNKEHKKGAFENAPLERICKNFL